MAAHIWSRSLRCLSSAVWHVSILFLNVSFSFSNFLICSAFYFISCFIFYMSLFSTISSLVSIWLSWVSYWSENWLYDFVLWGVLDIVDSSLIVTGFTLNLSVLIFYFSFTNAAGKPVILLALETIGPRFLSCIFNIVSSLLKLWLRASFSFIIVLYVSYEFLISSLSDVKWPSNIFNFS